MTEERMTELEIHVAHLETAQERMSEVLIRQQALLDTLAGKVEALTCRLDQATRDAAGDLPVPGHRRGED